MRIKTHFIIISLLLSVVTLNGQSKFNKPREDSLLTRLAANNKAMGSLAVMENGNLIYARAIGYREISPSVSASDAGTKYRIGSITKIFTSVMIFQLIEEGKLQLTATLDKFFPAIGNSGSITIGHMLNHRSGIHNFTNDVLYQTYMGKQMTRSGMVEIISGNKPDFEPGAKFDYSNSNYVLLGYIVEDLRGEPYEKALQKYICTKIGLSDTYYGGRTNILNNESYSFNYSGGWDRQPETDMSIPHGAGAIVSTPSDLVKFISALFDGKLISKVSLDQMKTITAGMGMGIMQFPYNGKIVYGHGGGIDGFNSILVYIPEDKVAVSYCSNGTVYAVNDILLRTLNNVFGIAEKLPEFDVYKVDLSELEKYPGVYSSPDFPLKLTISVNNGRLFGQGTGQPPFPLEATARDEFRFERAGIVIKFNPENKSLVITQAQKPVTMIRE